MSKKARLLFICTHNSARSQMAEGFLRHFSGGTVEAASAGTEPGTLNPLAVQVMAEQGIDISSQRAKPLNAFLQQPFEYVITVCDDANESCPVFPNARRRLHWSFPDPSRAEGTPEERLATFREVRDAIRARVERFLGDIASHQEVSRRQSSSTGRRKEMSAIPEWAFEFHGHRCPFMPIGYRMGQVAMRELGVEREKDHGLFAFSEMGSGHPNTCMEDGIQAATGSTYAKRVMQHLDYGKAAFVLYHPDKGAVRVSLRPETFDELGRSEFLAHRKRGEPPSKIPQEAAQKVVDWVLDRGEEQLFAVERLPDFVYQKPGPNPFEKVKCAKCGEYVFERYVRLVRGEPRCIPCCGYKG